MITLGQSCVILIYLLFLCLVQVSASMLELYNDRLQDLFVSPAEALSKRIEIKKDKKGLVFAQGAEAKEATSAGELFALFELCSANRHIAATSMF